MAARKPHKVRIAPGVRLDAVTVDEDLTVTKSWVEVSKTVADNLVDSTYQGRQKFEVEEGTVDEAEPETEAEDAGEAE
jgi:hypothetical protein